MLQYSVAAGPAFVVRILGHSGQHRTYFDILWPCFFSRSLRWNSSAISNAVDVGFPNTYGLTLAERSLSALKNHV